MLIMNRPKLRLPGLKLVGSGHQINGRGETGLRALLILQIIRAVFKMCHLTIQAQDNSTDSDNISPTLFPWFIGAFPMALN